MKDIDEIKKDSRLRNILSDSEGFKADIHIGGWDGSFILSYGAGWEHASVRPYVKRIIPSWDDMCKIKDMIWNEDEAVIQIHPPKADYVNLLENCLHLWRCTYKDMILPPRILVGIVRGQTPMEIRQEIKAAYEMAGEKYKPCIFSEVCEHDKQKVLEKIRERIELEKRGYPPSAGYYKAIMKVLQIIDEDKAEVEEQEDETNRC